MADGHLGPSVSGIMHGSLVPMAVQREALVMGQLGNVGQAVVELRVGGGQQSQADVLDDLSPAWTLQSGEVVRVAWRTFKAQPVFLKKSPSAFGGFEYPLHAQAKAGLVGELWAG